MNDRPLPSNQIPARKHTRKPLHQVTQLRSPALCFAIRSHCRTYSQDQRVKALWRRVYVFMMDLHNGLVAEYLQRVRDQQEAANTPAPDGFRINPMTGLIEPL